MQIHVEWNKPFTVVLPVFVQIEVLGRIKIFDDRSVPLPCGSGAQGGYGIGTQDART
jgi:hypothetical protein